MAKQIIGILLLVGAWFYFFVPARPSAPGGEIAWRTDAKAALRDANSDKKTLLVFSATWCPPCKQMKSDTWPDAQVARAARDYNAIWVDVDNHGELAQRFGVQGIPTVVVLDRQQREMGRMSGFVSPEEMTAWLGN
jgi:thiol:disulfide interchange protein